MRAWFRTETHFTLYENDVREIIAEAIQNEYGVAVDPKKDISFYIREEETRGLDDPTPPPRLETINVRVVQEDQPVIKKDNVA